MKISDILKYIVFSVLFVFVNISCDENVTDFGFDGAISGTIKDQAGNIIAGDISSNTLLVKGLTEGDIVTTDIRVKGDGTYQHTKLYPAPTKFWITGPVKMVGDTLRINFSDNNVVQHDFVVEPFLTMKSPVLVGEPEATSVTVSYEIVPNDENVAEQRTIYCSTIPYPSSSIGSGPRYETKSVDVLTNKGSTTITELASKTKYFIRVGARAKGSNSLNFSNQIIVTTP